jgi:hypothetical protein
MKSGVLLAVVTLSFGLQAVAQHISPAFRARGGVVEALPKTLRAQPSFAISDETRLKMVLAPNINALVAAKDFEGLDQMATELRRSKVETASGVWYLSTFYTLLTYEWTDTPEMTETAWMERQVFLNKWVQTNPTSITARVALGRYWKNYAWKARGLGYANSVTEAQWDLFAARLEKSREILVEARALKTKCPMWWDTLQFVALGQGWKVADFDAVFDDAVKFEPGYTQFYVNKATYLLPRWYGKEGDWQAFAQDAADKMTGEAGDMLYARIGWRIHQRGYYSGFARDAGYSWPRMKKGLQTIVEKHSDSVAPASELACLAYQAEDRECAKPMFERVGMVVDRNAWQDDMARFIRARTWAMMQY